MPLTPIQSKALRWLAKNKGCAKVDRYGRVSTASGDLSPHSCATFLRLTLAGYCCAHPLEHHVGITQKGLEAIR